MARIEWNESKVYKPETKRIGDFVDENSIAPQDFPQDEVIIFIERQALEGVYDFLSHDLAREHGGVLIGHSYIDQERNQQYINILATIPAQETIGSPVHLQFTPASWDFISGIIEESYSDKIVLGWYHSHPGLGVFMSGTDRATQKAFFYNPWNIAVVVDPVIKRTGWFRGQDCANVSPLSVFAYDKREASEIETIKSSEDFFYEGVGSLQKPPLKKYDWLLPFISISMLLIIGLTSLFLNNFLNNESQ